jgi:1-acyl-sn-glycerol-3-phosphate acyltransferase
MHTLFFKLSISFLEDTMQYTIFDTPGIKDVMRFFSILVLKVFGWKVEGSLSKDIQKCVVIAVPHTSNWDVPIMIGASCILRMPMYWMGKIELFIFPFNKIMMWIGCLPIDRSSSVGRVSLYAKVINEAPRPVRLVIAPEGTRKFVPFDEWHHSFYWIALVAHVPIVLAYMDYSKKKVGIGQVLYPTGNIEADMLLIRKFYKDLGVQGKYPEQSDI